MAELDKCIVICANCHAKKHTCNDQLEKFWPEIEKRSSSHKEIQKPANQDEIRRLYESGVKQINIAKTLGYSKGTISGIIGKLYPHKQLT